MSDYVSQIWNLSLVSKWFSSCITCMGMRYHQSLSLHLVQLLSHLWTNLGFKILGSIELSYVYSCFLFWIRISYVNLEPSRQCMEYSYLYLYLFVCVVVCAYICTWNVYKSIVNQSSKSIILIIWVESYQSTLTDMIKYVLRLEIVKSLILSKLVVRQSTIGNVCKTLASHVSRDVWNGSFCNTRNFCIYYKYKISYYDMTWLRFIRPK